MVSGPQHDVNFAWLVYLDVFVNTPFILVLFYLQVEDSARTRQAAKCRTCAKKLAAGLPMQQRMIKPDSEANPATSSSNSTEAPVQLDRDTALGIGCELWYSCYLWSGRWRLLVCTYLTISLQQRR